MIGQRIDRGAPVFVLGMHRSGTSLLAGTLQAAGLHLGDVNESARHNRRGNREESRFRALNDALLAAAGASWKAPPPGQVEWAEPHIGRGRDLVAAYEAGPRPWGFKDPRAVFTIEGWERLAPGARRVGVFRHPGLVAASLAARRGALWIAPADGLELWWRYNTELLRLWSSAPFPLLEFSEADRMADPLQRLCSHLGLLQDGAPFLAEDLVHQRTAAAVEPRYARLLDALREAAASTTVRPAAEGR